MFYLVGCDLGADRLPHTNDHRHQPLGTVHELEGIDRGHQARKRAGRGLRFRGLFFTTLNQP